MKNMKPLQIYLDEEELNQFREICPGRRGMTKVVRQLIRAFTKKAQQQIQPDPETQRILAEALHDPET